VYYWIFFDAQVFFPKFVISKFSKLWCKVCIGCLPSLESTLIAWIWNLRQHKLSLANNTPKILHNSTILGYHIYMYGFHLKGSKYMAHTVEQKKLARRNTRCQFHQHYKRHFGSFFYVHVTRKSCQNETFVQKLRAYNVDGIDGIGGTKNWLEHTHQHQTHTCSIQVLLTALIFVQKCPFVRTYASQKKT